jgi:hypothetical protein
MAEKRPAEDEENKEANSCAAVSLPDGSIVPVLPAMQRAIDEAMEAAEVSRPATRRRRIEERRPELFDDVIAHIFQFMDPVDVVGVANAVCKEFYLASVAYHTRPLVLGPAGFTPLSRVVAPRDVDCPFDARQTIRAFYVPPVTDLLLDYLPREDALRMYHHTVTRIRMGGVRYADYERTGAMDPRPALARFERVTSFGFNRRVREVDLPLASGLIAVFKGLTDLEVPMSGQRVYFTMSPDACGQLRSLTLRDTDLAVGPGCEWGHFIRRCSNLGTLRLLSMKWSQIYAIGSGIGHGGAPRLRNLFVQVQDEARDAMGGTQAVQSIQSLLDDIPTLVSLDLHFCRSEFTHYGVLRHAGLQRITCDGNTHIFVEMPCLRQIDTGRSPWCTLSLSSGDYLERISGMGRISVSSRDIRFPVLRHAWPGDINVPADAALDAMFPVAEDFAPVVTRLAIALPPTVRKLRVTQMPDTEIGFVPPPMPMVSTLQVEPWHVNDQVLGRLLQSTPNLTAIELNEPPTQLVIQRVRFLRCAQFCDAEAWSRFPDVTHFIGPSGSGLGRIRRFESAPARVRNSLERCDRHRKDCYLITRSTDAGKVGSCGSVEYAWGFNPFVL